MSAFNREKTLVEYKAADCPFYLHSPPAFYAVHGLTNGNVCETGCSWFDSGNCAAFRKLSIPYKVTAGQAPQETVRDTAKRIGISISEVRRRRRGEKS